jgi:hypothetical protein
LLTEKVYRGGIKKKSQVRALKMAATNTGMISKKIAMIDTATNNSRAIT